MHPIPPPHRPRRRRGTTVADLLVAATLLAALVTAMMTITVRSGRLRQQSRQHQLALDELSNQLDRLLSIDDDARENGLRDLVPSEHITHSLPGAVLSSETYNDKNGQRIMLSLNWDRPIESPPLSLVGWVNVSGFEETKP